MAFDVQQIRPLFRLEMGKPGSSFAMEIARKIGLPEEILQSAADKVGGEQINLERQLREIARDKRYWEGKRDRIRLAEKRTDELAERYEKELSELRGQHNKLIREAKDEACRLVEEANKRVENTIREIRESQAEKEKTRAARAELETFKEKLFGEQRAESEKLDRKMEQLRQREERRAERKERRGEPVAGKPAGETPSKSNQELAVGDKVRIEGQSAVGEVTEISGNKAVIAFGQIRTTIDPKRLEVISNNEYRQRVKEHRSQNAILTNYDTSKRRLDFRRQIDLRGERAADALDIVRDYIDETVMLGIPEVRILHGKGTGALKEEIRKYLRTVPEVAEAADEHVDLGGAGITVVRLNN
jgi:DNA mismatch repair protein MutS2